MSSQTRLFVGNLPEAINEKELHSAFSSYGEIVNLDLKSKTADENAKKNFAFITISTTHHDLETCIKHFSNQDFKGKRLYVTRARESFLERLQRERTEGQKANEHKKLDSDNLPKKNPVIKLSEKLNPRKRKVEHEVNNHIYNNDSLKKNEKIKSPNKTESPPGDGIHKPKAEANQKKQDADKKRMESLRKKRQEFKEKKLIIKTGLVSLDKVQNKKTIFSDDDSPKTTKLPFKPNVQHNKSKNKSALFDENDDSADELNFEIKKQYEGKKGQKVLDLQSRYKSDKRFTLDERFIESEDEEPNESVDRDDEAIELGATDEKAKQLNILQDVLGVSIKSKATDPTYVNKTKPKPSMLRFDPMQPDHAKFLAPVEEKPETKKSKKKKKEIQEEVKPQEPEPPKIEVSKEQFYKVSETLKEAIAQPSTFSLRSLFGNKEEDTKKDDIEQDTGYIPLKTPKDIKKKVKNPLDRGEKNPFKYDSSDSEAEDEVKEEKTQSLPEPVAPKAVWKENLFLSISDDRLKEGLAFFNKTYENEIHKERRELKSLMKKRIYNKERKNQMFQKKIGGRKKTMKKSYNRKKNNQ